MTVKTLLRRSVQRRTRRHTPQMRMREELAWKAVFGIWKHKKIDGLAYQKRIRKEADRKIV